MGCETPGDLAGAQWLLCYLSTAKHQAFYWSFGTVLLLLFITAPLALLFGFCGALAKRSSIPPLRWFGLGYSSIVRGVPDIIFFLFVPLALDQFLEAMRHYWMCPDWSEPLYRGTEFRVCDQAKLPLNSAPQWIHDSYGFTLAVVAFALVFGAFAAATIDGALTSVPKAQLETAAAYGMTPRQIFWRIHLPQMWRYALPGLSNLWQLLIKATPLLFLLGVEDIVYWASEIGKFQSVRVSDYPHPNWRVWYFLALLIFYLLLTWTSERIFAWLTRRSSPGGASRRTVRDESGRQSTWGRA